jgi:hypothetical protein
MKQSNIEGYILVPSVLPQRCTGCVFAGISRICDLRYREKYCSSSYSDGAEDNIYIEDTDEAKAAYVRARLGLTTP